MRSTGKLGIIVFVGLLIAAGLTGCDAIGEVFDRDNEVSGTIEALGESSVDLDDGNTYRVTSNTEYEGVGLDSFDDLQVGWEVDIEYEGEGSTRTALEIEHGEEEDDDGLLG